MSLETPTVTLQQKIIDLISSKKGDQLAAIVENLSSKEIIHLIGHLNQSQQNHLFTLLSPENAAEMLEEIPDIQAVHIIEDLSTEEAAAILDEMESDDQADLIMELDKQDAEAILQEMLPEEAASVRKLLGYESMYDWFGVPVVDDQQKLVGVVLRSDIREAQSERLTMEHLESQGIIGGEELRTMPVLLRAKRRLSWLSVNIFLNIIAASVIAINQDVLSSVIALAVFLPIISDMSGCSGNQAVAVSMRELSIGAVNPSEVFRVLRQEMAVGLINGLVLGLLIGAAAFFWKGSIYLGLVVGSALTLNTLLAVCLGGTVPLILKGFKVDPALASGPILTTITDMVGFFLTLTFASMALSHLGGL